MQLPPPLKLLLRQFRSSVDTARWRDEYTDVPVVTELAPGDPAQALVTASRGAALVVATFPAANGRHRPRR
jgi:hypothetical protein